jgi:hypothetical protein
MFVTSKLQVRGGTVPSSKNDRGTADVVVGRLYVVLVKEVAEAVIGVELRAGAWEYMSRRLVCPK